MGCLIYTLFDPVRYILIFISSNVLAESLLFHRVQQRNNDVKWVPHEQ